LWHELARHELQHFLAFLESTLRQLFIVYRFNWQLLLHLGTLDVADHVVLSRGSIVTQDVVDQEGGLLGNDVFDS
jgi:hypothetical protein